MEDPLYFVSEAGQAASLQRPGSVVFSLAAHTTGDFTGAHIDLTYVISDSAPTDSLPWPEVLFHVRHPHTPVVPFLCVYRKQTATSSTIDIWFQQPAGDARAPTVCLEVQLQRPGLLLCKQLATLGPLSDQHPSNDDAEQHLARLQELSSVDLASLLPWRSVWMADQAAGQAATRIRRSGSDGLVLEGLL